MLQAGDPLNIKNMIKYISKMGATIDQFFILTLFWVEL